ncbi:unnamed protein product [Schistosoma curassoni]|nr:unnamed protein product [Schistosoma curassoni]
MKLSTTDCLVVFCVIHLMVTDPIYAGTNTGGANLCVGYNGKDFINEGTYYAPNIRTIVGLINSTCNTFKKYPKTKNSH